jgi:hypothetical protein
MQLPASATGSPLEPGPRDIGSASSGNRSSRRPARRARRILLAACLIALTPAVVSYVATILEPSNSSLGIRSVEWLRDHGAAGLVTRIESIYYSLQAPAKGGPALHALPEAGLASGSGPIAQARGSLRQGSPGPGQAIDRPPRIRPLSSPALRGEGSWHLTQAGENAQDPPLLLSTFRSDPAEYPRLVAGVAWINTSRATVALYPGRLEPSVSLPARGSMEVPKRFRHKLLGTFNSGFKLADAGGGWALDGRTYAPMRDNQATFVRYRDGRYDVAAWHGGPRVPGSVVFARQNLPLIVSRGRPNPNLNDGPEWGATLGNAVQVWRSGIGVDRRGNLIYAAADYQTVSSLAKILIHAGAVRAMELDINSYWVSFNVYAAPGAQEPSKLLQEMERPAERYLTPDDRDFFAIYSG